MLKYIKNKPLEALLWLISSLIIVSALIYKLYSLNKPGVILSCFLTIILWTGFIKLIAKKEKEINDERNNNFFSIKKIPLINCLLMIIYSIIWFFSLYLLWKNRSDGALVSPWLVVPEYFFVLYFFLTTLLNILIVKAKNNKTLYQLNFLFIFAHYLISFIIAVIIYKIGYGYDPFIHQATMDLIDKQGSVDPKPFYYLGQYGFLIIVHKLSGISLIWLDKLLVPILSALFLPLALNGFIKKYFLKDSWRQILLLATMILPFSFFILSTPQNLAFLFLILSIFYGLKNHYFGLLLSLACLLIHPLAGIPALLLAILLSMRHYLKKEEITANKFKILSIVLFIIASLGIPTAFLISGQAQLNWNLDSYNRFLITLIPSLNLPYKESWLLNFAYFYGKNLLLIILALIISGTYLIFKKYPNNSKLKTPLLIAFGLFFSYLFSSQLSFNLISYEKDDFAKRLLIIIALLSLPSIIFILNKIIERALIQNKFYKIVSIIILSSLVTASLYFSYPRQDHYHNSKGYSVSKSDQEAISWIEKNSSGDYIVLANQQTSAMALRQFGFNRYYNNLYFYPIPTSGPLYQYFLSMVYEEANRETMNKTMELANVSEAYFILPKYWWAFPKILAEAKLSANSWQKIGDGQIYIFKYIK